jgi:hypothetical protein
MKKCNKCEKYQCSCDDNYICDCGGFFIEPEIKPGVNQLQKKEKSNIFTATMTEIFKQEIKKIGNDGMWNKINTISNIEFKIECILYYLNAINF